MLPEIAGGYHLASRSGICNTTNSNLANPALFEIQTVAHGLPRIGGT